jgi:hypothetical protein
MERDALDDAQQRLVHWLRARRATSAPLSVVVRVAHSSFNMDEVRDVTRRTTAVAAALADQSGLYCSTMPIIGKYFLGTVCAQRAPDASVEKSGDDACTLRTSAGVAIEWKTMIYGTHCFGQDTRIEALVVDSVTLSNVRRLLLGQLAVFAPLQRAMPNLHVVLLATVDAKEEDVAAAAKRILTACYESLGTDENSLAYYVF